MMKIGKNGEIIAVNGFDGGSYTPRYEYRTSVFLGDMSKEDLRIKALVKKRQMGAAAQDRASRLQKAQEEKQKYLRQDYISRSINARNMAAINDQRNAADKRAYQAMKTANLADINPWVGSPFAGFGNGKGEQRIHPDSTEDVEIVDTAMPSVREYGVQNWMQDPQNIVDRSESEENSYTPGKKVLQTMVDYAQSRDLSVVGLPVTMESMTDQERAVYAKYMDQSGLAVNSNESSISPSLIRYGIYAVIAAILLR